MTIIYKIENQHYIVCKGSPEVIKQFCASVPNEFDNYVEKFAASGQRIIALASKKIFVQDIDKPLSKLMKNLELDGIISFQNEMNKNVKQIVQNLNKNQINTAIVTGDNIYTSIKVGVDLSFYKSNKIIICDYENKFDYNSKNSDMENSKSSVHQEIQGRVEEIKQILFQDDI